MNKKNYKKNKAMVIAAMLGAITIVLGLTPLGFIPLGVMNATTMHIPVIIAGIIEGPFIGAVVGLIFGISSLLNALLKNATPIAFVFYNPIVSVLPRVLIGITSYYAYRAFLKFDKNLLKKLSYILWTVIIIFLTYLLFSNFKTLKMLNIILFAFFMLSSIGMIVYTKIGMNENFPIAIGAFIGSMTNTILVLGFIYIIYAKKYMTALNLPVEGAKKAILGISITSGLPEAVLSVIIVTAVVRALKSRRG